MLLACKNITKILPIIRLELYNNKENSLIVPTKFINEILLIIKNHFKYQFKVLTCISGTDNPENLYRFHIVYDLLSLKFNTRLRLKILIDELIPVQSIENIFLNAS
jgi:NADH:ubiquinone oxidoreductase subunit C